MLEDKENLYWWCPTCKSQVDILIGYGVGIFCILCGDKVESPIDIKEPPIYWDNEDVSSNTEE